MSPNKSMLHSGSNMYSRPQGTGGVYPHAHGMGGNAMKNALSPTQRVPLSSNIYNRTPLGSHKGISFNHIFKVLIH